MTSSVPSQAIASAPAPAPAPADDDALCHAFREECRLAEPRDEEVGRRRGVARVVERLTSIDWRACNVLLYGHDRHAMHAVVSELLRGLNHGKPPYMSTESVSKDNAFVRVSAFHHEFDFARAYNSAAVAALVARVLELAKLRRLGGKRHIVFLRNLDGLSGPHVAKLASAVQQFSDRTCFVITTTKISRVPPTMRYSCVPTRCPSTGACADDDNVVARTLKKVFAHLLKKNGAVGKQVAVAKALREVSYSCLGANVRLAYVAGASLRALVDLGASDDLLATVAETFAVHEAASHHARREVLAWEGAFLQVVAAIVGRPPSKAV